MEKEQTYTQEEAGNEEMPDMPKNFGTAIKQVILYFRHYWVLIIISMIFAAASSVLLIVGADKLSDFTDLLSDGIEAGINMSKVKSLGLLIVGIYGLSALLSVVQGYQITDITQKATKKMRKEMSDKLMCLPMEYFHKTETGDILSRVTNDVDTICESLNISVTGFVSSLTMFVMALIMMFATNVLMAITAIVSTIIGFIFLILVTGFSQKYFVQQQKNIGRINGFIEEQYSGHVVIKAFSRENKVKEQFEKYNDDLRKSNYRAECISSLMSPIMVFVGHLGYVSVCVVGAVLTMKSHITFGVIVAFIMYVNYFTQPMAMIAQGVQALQSVAAAGERVFEFLELEEMPSESHKGSRIKKARGNVRFNNIKFSYDNSDNYTINNFSLDVKQGQKVAIVGPTGAGKTTLVNLLMRFYEVNKGSISIDGVPIKSVKRSAVRDLIGMVLQDTWIFEGTIRDNLVLCRKDITDERLDEVCKAVGLYHFLNTLPDKYDTVLNEKIELSVGQKQQLAIARALATDKKMIILDEATSSVDTRLEQNIQQAMDNLTKGRTSFVIAHRLSTIVNADVIIVMKDGQIVEHGKHKDLIKKRGVYYDLYTSQFEV